MSRACSSARTRGSPNRPLPAECAPGRGHIHHDACRCDDTRRPARAREYQFPAALGHLLTTCTVLIDLERTTPASRTHQKAQKVNSLLRRLDAAGTRGRWVRLVILDADYSAAVPTCNVRHRRPPALRLTPQRPCRYRIRARTVVSRRAVARLPGSPGPCPRSRPPRVCKHPPPPGHPRPCSETDPGRPRSPKGSLPGSRDPVRKKIAIYAKRTSHCNTKIKT
jgi:hypothetical protein